MSLQDPNKKMSKSDEIGLGCIELLDNLDLARKKIMRAVTDSGSEIEYNTEEKPALSNLLTIYAMLGNREIKRLVKDFKGKGYGDFKKDLAEVVVKFLDNFQKKYNSISDDEVMVILEEGKEKLNKIAEEKMEIVRRAIGVR